MRQETELELLAAESIGAKYDETCRMLFLNKEIVAPILLHVVPEYQDSTIDEVLDCIDGKLIRYDSRTLTGRSKLSVSPKIRLQGAMPYAFVLERASGIYKESVPHKVEPTHHHALCNMPASSSTV